MTKHNRRKTDDFKFLIGLLLISGIAAIIILINQAYAKKSESYYQDKLCAKHELTSKAIIYNSKTLTYVVVCTKK